MPNPKPITILMADDDPDDRQLTKEAFEEARLANDLRFVEDGVELLDYLHRRGKYADPDTSPRPGIILLDLNLPGTDGREVLEMVKADENLKRIPVVVLTTSTDERDVDACYRAGANSYVKKPVDLEGFMQAIERLNGYWFEVVILPLET